MPHRPDHRRLLGAAALVAAALLLAACGEGDAGDDTADDDGPARVVATTSVVGDLVRAAFGDAADVEVMVPAGADPHEVQPSAQQARALREADLIVAVGGGFEAGLQDVLDAAEGDGVHVHDLIDGVIHPLAAEDHDGAATTTTTAAADGTHPHHAPPVIDDPDPHFFTDPSRAAEAIEAMTAHIAFDVPALAAEAVRSTTVAAAAALRALDAEVEEILAVVPAEQRKLVTNHEVLSYFADRYGFEVLGAAIPTTSTQGAPDAAALSALAATIRAAGVHAIFTDVASGDRLLRVLADEAGDVEVVPLYTESLGPAGSPGATYEGMIRTNAERIADALS